MASFVSRITCGIGSLYTVAMLSAGLVAPVVVLAEESNEAVDTAQPITEQRWAYVILDQVDVQGPQGLRWQWSSNALAFIHTQGNVITVELRPDLRRPPALEGDSPANQVRSRGVGAPIERDLPAARLQVEFEPGERGPVGVSGVAPAHRDLLEGLLAQGPSANILTTGASVPYAMQLQSDDQPVILRGVQKNGDLWVDLSFSGMEAVVGAGGWQLPIELGLPEQQPLAGLRVRGLTGVRYGSVRVGPETESQSTLLFAMGEWRMRRETTIRPVSAANYAPYEGTFVEIAVPAAAVVPVSQWSSALGISQAAVQRLAGLREMGLGAWLTQVATDVVYADMLAESPALQEAADGLAGLLPPVGPPPRGTVSAQEFAEVDAERVALSQALDEAEIALAVAQGDDWSLYAGARITAMIADFDNGNNEGERSGVAVVSHVEVGYLFGERWRVGPVLSLGVADGHSRNENISDGHSWVMAGAFIAGAFYGEDIDVTVRAGGELAAYGLSGTDLSLNGEELLYTGVLDARWRAFESLGVGLAASYGTGTNATIIRGAPSLIWWVNNHTQAALHVEYADFSLNYGDSDTASMVGYGLGIGIRTRW